SERLAEISHERAMRHRLREEEALAELATEILQRLDLALVLDALGDDLEAEALADGDDRGGEAGSALSVGPEERAVHLEDVDRQPAEIAERGVAGAEVVHRDA